MQLGGGIYIRGGYGTLTSSGNVDISTSNGGTAGVLGGLAFSSRRASDGSSDGTGGEILVLMLHPEMQGGDFLTYGKVRQIRVVEYG